MHEPEVGTVKVRTNREREEKELYDKIDKDNKILLSKMTDIIVHPQPLYQSSNVRSGSVAANKNSLNAESR